MIGTWSVNNEKALAAHDHYNALKGVDRLPVVWKGPFGSLFLAVNGQVQDDYGNWVLDLPVDPVLETLDDVVAYVAAHETGGDNDHD
jgi:hypothetical protein